MDLKSRNVFIDTESFVRMKFNFHGEACVAFAKICGSGKLSHFVTTVVKHEVEGKIEKEIALSLALLSKFRKDSRTLERMGGKIVEGYFLEPDEVEIHKRAIDEFHEYLSATGATIVGATKVNVETILSLYFASEPPFGKGKKKAEFPDAISLLSLIEILDGDSAYVISGDPDMENFCAEHEQLIHLNSLPKILDLYNKHESTLTILVKEYFDLIPEDIRKEIVDTLQMSGVYNDSSWMDSEVEDFFVTEIYDMDPSVLWIGDSECLLTFDVDVDLEYSVVGPDSECSYYDPEDHKVYSLESLTAHSSGTETFTVEVRIGYDLGNKVLQNIKVLEVRMPGIGDGIAVNVEEDEAKNQ